VAGAVEVRSVRRAEGRGPPLPADGAAEAFAALCDRAAERGLLVHIEFWPGSALDLATAASVVASANRPNGGLLVDTWHLVRTRGGTELLRGIPGDRIMAVQGGGLPPVGEPEADYPTAAPTPRLPPGEGALDRPGLVRLLDARGALAPIGVEVCSERLAAEPPETVARRAGDAVRALLAAARP